jgi:hypothetical protein
MKNFHQKKHCFNFPEFQQVGNKYAKCTFCCVFVIVPQMVGTVNKNFHNLRVWFSTTLANIDSIISFSTKPFVNYLVLNISSRYGNTYKHTRDLPTVYKCKKRARLRNQCIQKGGGSSAFSLTDITHFHLVKCVLKFSCIKVQTSQLKTEKEPSIFESFSRTNMVPQKYKMLREGDTKLSSIRFTLGGRYITYYWCFTQNNSQKV